MLGQERMNFKSHHIFSPIPMLSRACRQYGTARPPYDSEQPHSRASIRFRHRHPPCVVVGRPDSHRLILDHHKINPSDIHTGMPRIWIRCPFIHPVLPRSGVDKPSPRTSNIKYNLPPTQKDEPPSVPVTSLIGVNIYSVKNTPTHIPL